MKDKVAHQQLSSAETMRQAFKEVWVTEMSMTAKEDVLNTEK